jgi:8-oxo-dGTP pyrophosphatase MutT (NUDIX family)
MPGGESGNGWVTCAQGHQHWGLFGAAGVLVYVPHATDPAQSLVLLQHRAKWSHQGGTWALPGGAMDSDETPAEAALREADEEVMLDPKLVVAHGQYTDDHGGWAYHTVLAEAPEPVKVYSDAYESDEAVWRPAGSVDQLDLHPGFAETWPILRQALVRLTLFVDGTGFPGDPAEIGPRLWERLTELTRSGLTELPDGAPGPALARWYPDYVLVLGKKAADAAESAAARAAAADAAREAAMRPSDRWNAPPTVRTAGTRIVATADGARAGDVIAQLAENTPGNRLVADLDWLLSRSIPDGTA